MKSKINNSIKFIFLILIMSMLIIMSATTKVAATNFSITSGISSTTVGNTYTISINASGLTGRFNITHSSNVSVNVDSVWIDNGVVDSTIKVTAKETGKATVTVTPYDVSDSSTGNPITSLSGKTDTVTVKANSTNSSGSSSSGSSSKGSSSSSSQQKPTFSEKNDTVYATDSVNVRSSYSTSSSVIGSLEPGDSVKRTGLATKAVNGITWSRVSYNGTTGYVSSSYLTTEKPEESNNKDLKSLSLKDETLKLTPEFSKDVTEYSLNVPDNMDILDIEAVAEDENAKVEITGNDDLLMGENTVEIKVTAEDGTVRTYTINVTKGDVDAIADNTIALESLSIDGYTLSPEFSKNIYEYTVDVPDVSVTSLNVNAISNTEEAAIEIIGNNNLTVGENVITVLVKSSDGSEVTTYQVIANIHQPEKTQLIAGIDDEDLFLYGGVGLAALVVIIIIIIVAIVKSKKNDDDYGTYYGGFTSLNNDDEDKKKTKKAKKDSKDNVEESKEKANKEDTKKTEDIVENVPVGVTANNKEADKQLSDANKKEEKRRSVIEENFGADINIDDLNDDEPKRKRGKHF